MSSTDPRQNPLNCSKCGGEKDFEGWCANYCLDDEGEEVAVCDAEMDSPC